MGWGILGAVELEALQASNRGWVSTCKGASGGKNASFCPNEQTFVEYLLGNGLL